MLVPIDPGCAAQTPPAVETPPPPGASAPADGGAPDHLGGKSSWDATYRDFFTAKRQREASVSTAHDSGLCLVGEKDPGYTIGGAHNAGDFSLSLWIKATAPCLVKNARELRVGVRVPWAPRAPPKARAAASAPWYQGCMLIGPQWAYSGTQWDPRTNMSYNDFGLAMATDGRVVFGVGHRRPLAPRELRHEKNLDGWDFRSPTEYNPKTRRDFVHEGEETELWSAAALDDGAWHHVAATRRRADGALALYVDGRLERAARSANRELMSDAEYELSVGLSITGCVRGAALEHRARDAAAVAALMASTALPRPPPLYLTYLYSPASDADAGSRELRDRFVASVRAWGDDGVVLEERTPEELAMGSGSVEGGARTIAKLGLVDRALASHADGDVVVVSDLDLRFYRPLARLVHEYIAGRDAVFQRDNDYTIQANIGFMALRVTNRTRAFWAAVRAFMDDRTRPSHTFNDQKVVNMLLTAPRDFGVPPESALRWDLLPPEIMTAVHMRQMPLARWSRNWIQYHANFGGTRDAATARDQKVKLIEAEERELFAEYAVAGRQRARVCECW